MSDEAGDTDMSAASAADRQCVSNLAFTRIEDTCYAWTSPLYHHESRNDDRGRIHVVVRGSRRFSARHGHSIWTTLRYIVALVLLSGQPISKKDYRVRLGLPYMPAHQFAQADYGTGFASAEASRPPSGNESDVQHPDPSFTRNLGSKPLLRPPSEADEEAVRGNKVGNKTNESGRVGAVATRTNAPTGLSSEKGTQTEAHRGVSIVDFSSLGCEGADESKSCITETDSELPGDRPESETGARDTKTNGRLTFKCGSRAELTAVAGGGHVLRETKHRQELASRGCLQDDSAQQVFKDGELQRRSLHKKPVQQRQIRAMSDAQQQQQRTDIPPDTFDMPLQQHETSNMLFNEKQVQARGRQEQEASERRLRGKTGGIMRSADENSFSFLNDGRSQQQAADHTGPSTPEVNDQNDFQKRWSAFDISASQMSSLSQDDNPEESSTSYFDHEGLSREELRAAQNSLMADVTAHLSRLWRKHWLQAIEATNEHCYEDRLQTLRIIVEQMEIAVNSIILSRPRCVSMGLGRWLHKVREVFLFVFSTRLGLGVASADLRPVGPLAATAHDIPEESAEVVEVVTGASQRVLLLAPASRKENARCYASGSGTAWQQIQASLFPAGVPARLMETQASLAKLLDLLEENVATLAKDHSIRKREPEAALTHTTNSTDTCDDNGSCRYRPTATLRDDLDDTAHSFSRVNKKEIRSAQRLGKAYLDDLYRRAGSEYGTEIPYSSSTALLPSESGQTWDTHAESGVRLANLAEPYLSDTGDHAARMRREGMNRSEDLHKSPGVQLPILPETSTLVEKRMKLFPAFEGAHSVSAASDVREGDSAGDDMCCSNQKTPAAQKSTIEIENEDNNDGVSSSTSRDTRTSVKLESGDNVSRTRLAEEKFESRHTRGSVVDVSDSALAESRSSSSRIPETEDITKPPKKSSLSGVYKILLEATEPVPSLAYVGDAFPKAADDSVMARRTSASSVATSLGQAWDELSSLPVGGSSVVSDNIGTDISLGVALSPRGDRKALEREADGAEDATASHPDVEHGIERKTSDGSDTFVSIAQKSDASSKSGPVLGGGNASLRLSSDSVGKQSSYIKNNRQNRRGGEVADAIAGDEASNGSAKGPRTEPKTDLVVLKEFLEDNDSSPYWSQNTAQLQGEKPSLLTSFDPRNVQSHAGATDPYCKGSPECSSSNTDFAAGAGGAILTLDTSRQTSGLLSKSGGEGALPDKLFGRSISNKIVHGNAVDVTSHSKHPATPKSESGGNNFSINGKYMGTRRSVGYGDDTSDNHNTISAGQSSDAQDTTRMSRESHLVVETSSSSVSAECNNGTCQSSTAPIVSGETLQESSGGAGKTSQTDSVIAPDGPPFTEGTANSSHPEDSDSDIAGRMASTTKTREAFWISEGQQHGTRNAEGIDATDLASTDIPVANDDVPTGKQTREMVVYNTDVVEPGGSRSVGNGAKTSRCNSIKTDRGVDVVYCIREESDEGTDYVRGMGNDIASPAINEYSLSRSDNVSGDAHLGGIVTRQTPVSEKLVEVEVSLQKEAQHRSSPVPAHTSLLQPGHADFVEVSEPVSADQQTSHSLQPRSRDPEHTGGEIGAAEKAGQSSRREKTQVNVVVSEPRQRQGREPPGDSLLETKRLQKQTSRGMFLDQVRPGELQKKREPNRTGHQPPPHYSKTLEQNGVYTTPTQRSAVDASQDTVLDQQEEKRKVKQVSLLNTAEQLRGSQPSVKTSETAKPPKHLPGKGDQQQQHRQTFGHAGQPSPSLAVRQVKTRLPWPQQISSEQQHEFGEIQDVQKQVEAVSQKKASAQGKLDSTPPLSVLQKVGSSTEHERGSERYDSVRVRTQQQPPKSPSHAKGDLQEALRHALKPFGSEAVFKNSKQNLTESVTSVDQPRPDRSSKKSIKSEHAELLPEHAVPREADSEREKDEELSVSSEDSRSARLPAAGRAHEPAPLNPPKSTLHRTYTAASLDEPEVRDVLHVEPTHGVTARTTAKRIEDKKSPWSGRTGIKGNVERRERGQERATPSRQLNAGVQRSPLLLKPVKKEHGAPPHRHLLKQIQFSEQEQPKFFKAPLMPRWFQAGKHRMIQHPIRPKEKADLSHWQEKEAQRRAAGKISTQQSQLLQASHHAAVVPPHKRKTQQFQLEMLTSLQTSAVPRRQGGEQADKRRVRRWARVPRHQQHIKGTI